MKSHKKQEIIVKNYPKRLKQDSKTQDECKDGFCDGAQNKKWGRKLFFLLMLYLISKLSGCNDKHIFEIFKESMEM